MVLKYMSGRGEKVGGLLIFGIINKLSKCKISYAGGIFSVASAPSRRNSQCLEKLIHYTSKWDWNNLGKSGQKIIQYHRQTSHHIPTRRETGILLLSNERWVCSGCIFAKVFEHVYLSHGKTPLKNVHIESLDAFLPMIIICKKDAYW